MVKIVGILNVTPDSFSDGGLYSAPEVAVQRTEELFRDGADLVDIGAESTRPEATPITWQEEWGRLSPILPKLIPVYGERLSLDTYHPETAEAALNIGPIIINDVSGMSEAMMDIVAKYQARCVIGHIPEGTDTKTAHEGDLIDDVEVVVRDLMVKVDKIQAKGLAKEKIYLDPCIGFGKTQALNEKLLEFAKEVPDFPVMIGYSKKRFLGTDDERKDKKKNQDAGQTATDAGAAYLRVHDVEWYSELKQAA
ncbi:MAG: dihydropteroate synthase [Patescibacteria group bacterium]